jgi:hypothetical protein
LTRALVSWTEKYILGEDLTPPFRFDFSREARLMKFQRRLACKISLMELIK